MSIGSVTNSYGTSGFQTGCPACSSSSDQTAPEQTDSTLKNKKKPNTAAQGTAQNELSAEEKKQVVDLKKRDREVKAHEAAHMAAGGGYVRGGASYSYQTGPDGKRYAVGGEVSIDTSAEDDPNATIRKMQTVRSAALAPANPSGQDRSVAAAASAMEAKARQQLHGNKEPKDSSAVKKGEKSDSGTSTYTPEGKNSTAASSPTVDFSA
jgi:hypothetical protein